MKSGSLYFEMNHSFTFKSALFIVKSRAPWQFIIKLDCFKGRRTFAPTVSYERWTELRAPNVWHVATQTVAPSPYTGRNTEMKYPLGHLPQRKHWYWETLLLNWFPTLFVPRDDTRPGYFFFRSVSTLFSSEQQSSWKRALVNTHTKFKVTWRQDSSLPMSP